MVFPERNMLFFAAVAAAIFWATRRVGEGRTICTQFSMAFPSSYSRIS
jgi:hypothetical protein